MREGELEIFFKSANPGVKRMGEEKKAPSNKFLKTLAVGRRANARGSAALKSERSGKMASLLFANDEQHAIYLIKDVKSGVAADQAGC